MPGHVVTSVARGAPRHLLTRHPMGLLPAMPSKRKRNEPQPPPPAPNLLKGPDGPRRSGRIKDHSYLPINSEKSDGEDMEIDTNQNAMGLWDTKEGVEKAMRDLSEMEHRLQSAVRKQRLAVESSDLSVQKAAAVPQYAERMKENDPEHDTITHNKAGTDTESLSRDPINGHDAELALDDVEDAKMDNDCDDRCARRPPPVNSDRLPLPWTGRLGYACLNTYLRTASPSVFSSRTCRLGSILEHRYPLLDPDQPEHPTKNRPDRTKEPDIERGRRYVEALGLANARDIPKMLRWNHKYGINFMRLSSEMFPFASHEEHGYKLAPFAAAVLADAGRVAAELGHRLTMHPGQFTQIGSPRKEVVRAAFRDLEYHDELLTLLKLPEQMDRDAVMILHMGGTYGDKAATIDRFKHNYTQLSQSIKQRLVLENDDVSWSVHDLLPTCEELNIPLVLDFHHHNIIFDPSIREGTQDVIGLFDRIKKTWTRKSIRQKMHYSEPTAGAVTPRDRRKHSPRVKTLPPCVPDMDLMIEAKDKEQAVFELMRTYRLPGWDSFNNIVPHERDDESRKAVKRKGKKGKKKTEEAANGTDDDIEIPEKIVSEDDFAMGGAQHRVYWPEGMEDWLKPQKRELKKGKKTDE